MKSKPTTVGNEKQQNITVEMMTPLPSIQVHSVMVSPFWSKMTHCELLSPSIILAIVLIYQTEMPFQLLFK